MTTHRSASALPHSLAGRYALPSLMMVLALGACAGPMPTRMVDPHADRTGLTMGLDQRDFSTAARDAVQSMLASGALDKHSGGRYVLAISRITNETMQHFDTDVLVKKIRDALYRSGKVVTTTAVGLNGAEDPLSMRYRQLRASSEFNRATVARKGEMIAPDLSLSGKIIQNDHMVDGGARRVDYAVQLTLTDLHTGLALWENETPFSKVGDGRTVSW